jgi:dihydroorotate dehydrogenase (fumarate)
MVDLTTNYLGLALKNPLVVSASPFSRRIDRVRKLEQNGAAAVVMYSLFEEQVSYEVGELNPHLSNDPQNYDKAISYYPHLAYYNLNPDEYIQHLYLLKKSVSIPVIGSINGVSSGGWLEYAHHMEQAGADALEINLYYLPTNPDFTGADLEETYVRLVKNVKARLTIPFAVKLHPSFSSLPNFSKRIVEAGARGLVFFNRFYQPDIDLEKLKVVPSLDLSSSQDLRLPLRWIAILYGRIPADFALSSGIHSGHDVIKAVMAGASVTMLTSELLQNGIDRLGRIKDEVEDWLAQHNYSSLSEIKGIMSQKNVTEPAAFERAYYLKVLNNYQ